MELYARNTDPVSSQDGLDRLSGSELANRIVDYLKGKVHGATSYDISKGLGIEQRDHISPLTAKLVRRGEIKVAQVVRKIYGERRPMLVFYDKDIEFQQLSTDKEKDGRAAVKKGVDKIIAGLVSDILGGEASHHNSYELHKAIICTQFVLSLDREKPIHTDYSDKTIHVLDNHKNTLFVLFHPKAYISSVSTFVTADGSIWVTSNGLNAVRFIQGKDGGYNSARVLEYKFDTITNRYIKVKAQ